MGKRYLAFLLAFLLLMIGVKGEAQDIRYWSDGPLTISDFTVVDEPEGTLAISFIWDRKKMEITRGKTRYVYYDYNNGFFKKNTMIGKSRVSECSIDSLQYLFDLSEYYVRKIREEVISEPWKTKKVVSRYSREFRTERDRSLKKNLSLSEDRFDITEIQLEKTLGINPSIGLFTQFPFGDMASLVRCFYGCTVGFGLSYNKLTLQPELSFGSGSYLGSYSNIRGANSASKIPMTCFRIYISYILTDFSNYRLAVIAGGGRSAYRFYENETFSVVGNVLSEGIRLDWKNRTSYILTFPVAREVVFCPYVMLISDQQWINSNKTISPSVSLTVGLSLDVHATRSK